MMDGVQFVVDGDGNKKAVLIDLDMHGDLLEDFFDIVISRERLKEPMISWEQAKAELDALEEANVEEVGVAASV